MSSHAETTRDKRPRAGRGGRMRAVLPRRRRRLLTTAAGVVIGAGLGVLYARGVSLERAWLTLAIGGLGGAALGYLAIAIPRFAFHFLLREWYRTVANHWRALVNQRAERARRLLADSSEPQQLANLGIAHYLRGGGEEALRCLSQARSEAGGDRQLLNAFAAAAAERGQWQEAAAALAEALSEQPEDPMSLSNLATLLAEMPPDVELPGSLEAMLQAAGARALNNVAVRQMQLDNAAEARSYLQLALAEQPLYPHAQANLGVLAFDQNEPQTALVNLAAAAQFAPTDPDILSDLGALLAVRGNYGTAERVLNRVRRLDARHAGAIINQGCVQIHQGREEEAIDLFHEVPAEDPLLGLGWHNAAVAWEATGEHGQAREYEEMAIAQRPDNADALTSLGALEWRLGNYEQADEYFRRVLEIGSVSVAGTVNAARAAVAGGRLEEALAVLKGLEEGRRDDAQLLFDLGVTQLMVALERRKRDMNPTEQELFHNALRSSIQAFEQNLAHKEAIAAEARLNLGLAYYLAGEPDLAAQHFEEAAKLLPADSGARLCAGTAYVAAGMRVQEDRGMGREELIPEARRLLRHGRTHLEKAAADTSADPDVFNNLGMACYQLGQVDDTMKALRRLVQLETSVDANNSLALIYAKQGQNLYEEAQAGRSTGESTASKTMMEKARRMLSTAIHYFTQALRLEPHNPVLHGNIGLAHMLRNGPDDMDAALNHWQLMRAAGDEWAERQFVRMMEIMQTDQTAKATFHDVGAALRPIRIERYIQKLPPVMGRPVYVVEPVMHRAQWQLEATHPDLRVALRARQKLLRLNQRLQRLAV